MADEDDGGEYKLSELQSRFQSMSMIEQFLGKGSVLGKSSGLALIQHALELKQNPNAYTIGQDRSIPSRREDLWDPSQVYCIVNQPLSLSDAVHISSTGSNQVTMCASLTCLPAT